jgi:hypothetical protein
MRLIRRLVDPCHRVILEVGLLDVALNRRDLVHQGHTRGKHRRAFKLGLHALRMHDEAGIDRQVHTRDAHLPPIVDLDLDNRGYIAEEAAVRGKPERMPLPRLLVPPAGALRHDFDHAPQAGGIHRILAERFPIVGVGRALGLVIDLARAAQHIPKKLDPIAARGDGKLIDEGLDEGVVNIGHRAQPADAHMILRRSVLGAQVRDVERQVHPPLSRLAVRSVTR